MPYNDEQEIFIPPMPEEYADLDDTPDPSPTEPHSKAAISAPMVVRSTTPHGRTPTPAVYPSTVSYPVQPSSRLSPVYRQYPLRLQHYRKSKGHWGNVPKPSSEKRKTSKPLHGQFTLVTWNVDFASHFPHERMEAALEHLRNKTLEVDKTTKALAPCVVFLQEVHEKMLEILRENPWVRDNFHVTPFENSKWPPPHRYGNVTLVHRSIQVEGAFLLEYRQSAGSRTALIIDVKLRSNKVLRLVNTHLESMPENALLRREQLAMCARFCKAEEVDGGIIAGDLNSIDWDSDEQTRGLNLEDAYRLSRGKLEDGYTWGYQCNTESDKELPKGRLDRILFTPGKCFSVTQPDIEGRGATDVAGRYISDHFGLSADISIDV